jgi:hypothetical protein
VNRKEIGFRARAATLFAIVFVGFGSAVPARAENLVKALPSAAVQCGAELGTCTLPSGAVATVYYGAGASYAYLSGKSGSVGCNPTTFGGDPDVNVVKACYAIVTALPAGVAQCSGELGTCNLASGVTGTVYYGAGSSYTYGTNLSGEVACAPATFGGDPDVNVVKGCYAPAADASAVKIATALPSAARQCSAELGNCTLPTGAVATVYYGAGDNYAYLSGQSVSVPCNPTAFGGDPDQGLVKACYAIITALPAGVTQCGSELGTCALPSGALATVYYGAGGSYAYLNSQSGNVACSPTNFGGDPDVNVVKACYAAPVVSVNLAAYFNVPALSTDAANVGANLYGLQDAPYTYSINAIGGSTINWNGSTFNLGPANANDAVTSTVVPLPAGRYGRLDLLASRANGSVTETFVVTYTDGTTSSFSQGMSDWWNNSNGTHNYPGESTAAYLSYLHFGAQAASYPQGYPQAASIFGYSFALNASKTVASLKLPTDGNVGVLAMNLGPANAAPTIPAAGAAQSVVTYHNDTWRTGANSAEYQLTPATVANLSGASVFGRLGRVALDGQVDAQPLVVPKVSVAGDPNAGTHDVVYVATENNTVYAIDPIRFTVLASRNLGAAVNNPIGFGQGVAGIRGTPVIDTSKGAMYVVAYVQPSGGGAVQYQLHMLSLSTLADMVTPVTIAPTAKLTNGATLAFNAAYQMQRPALLESGGLIVVAFGSWGDLGANLSRGWVLSFNASTLAPNSAATDLLDTQVSNSADLYLASVWMSGNGPAVDQSGNVYFSTGNSAAGTYDGVTALQESVVKIAPGTGKLLSIYTPDAVNNLDDNDLDIGAGGVLLLPNAAKPYGAILSKDAIIRIFNRGNLGGNNDANLVASVPADGCWCSLSYFNDGEDRLVSSGGNNLRVFTWQTTTAPVLLQQGSAQIPSNGSPGSVTSISQGGSSNAIIWTTPTPWNFGTGGENVNLMAFQAQPVNGVLPLLYMAPAGTWSYGGGGSDHNPPTVANGRVYVASQGELVIFGFGGAR